MRSPSRALLPGPRHSCAPCRDSRGHSALRVRSTRGHRTRQPLPTPAGTPSSAATCSRTDSNRAPSHIACRPRAMRHLYASHGRSPGSATRPHPGAHAHPSGIWRLRRDPRVQLPARGGLRTGRARVFGARSGGRSRRTLRRHGIDLLPARSLENRGGNPRLTEAVQHSPAVEPQPSGLSLLPNAWCPASRSAAGAPDRTHPDFCAPKCT